MHYRYRRRLDGLWRKRHGARQGRLQHWRFSFATTEQALQQPRALCLFRALKRRQGLALQAAQLTQQQRHLAGLTGAGLDLFGELLQRPADVTGQRQGLQLGNQRGEGGADLSDTGLAALLGIEHGFFQARDQPGEGGVHVVGADDLAHLLHTLIHRPVAAFGGQGAAHQTTAQQVETGFPTALELLLLFDTLEVLFFPALGFVGHAWVRRGVMAISSKRAAYPQRGHQANESQPRPEDDRK
ncbi:hypothetical protein D3C84_722920 [compost metagenome]